MIILCDARIGRIASRSSCGSSLLSKASVLSPDRGEHDDDDERDGVALGVARGPCLPTLPPALDPMVT